MLQLAEILSFKEILRIKDEFKITKPHLPVMKGIHNTKGNPFCLPFLLGGHCDSTDPTIQSDTPPGTLSSPA